jgi:hypothetical protein
MSTGIRRRAGLLMAALALTFSAGCDNADSPLAPAEPQSTVVVGDDNREYTLVEGTIPPGLPSLQVSDVIGVLGGSISLAGHTITVPAGAVPRPTLFIMTLRTNGYVAVDLRAYRLGFFRIIDVGSDGFANGATVKLSLTYSWATNVTDPTQLRIVRRLGGGNVEVLESHVDTDAQVVETELDHFSGYAMAL